MLGCLKGELSKYYCMTTGPSLLGRDLLKIRTAKSYLSHPTFFDSMARSFSDREEKAVSSIKILHLNTEDQC